MKTNYYVGASGNYLGQIDTRLAPAGATSVPSAPAHTNDVWNFNSQSWTPYAVPNPPGMVATVAASYAQNAGFTWEVFAFLDAIRFGGFNEGLRKGVWAQLKRENAGLGPAWLIPSLKSSLVQWAAAHNMPIE